MAAMRLIRGDKLPVGTFSCKCGRDDSVGSGEFHMGGGIVNGKFTGKIGVCFGCEGKGYMTQADVTRCRNYWRFFGRVPV